MNQKKALRPNIPSITHGQYSSTLEEFQNKVLRPILKLQHEVIVHLFYKYTLTRNKGFLELSIAKKEAWVKQLVRKDIAFRNLMIGVVVGMMEVADLEVYTTSVSEFNKRIIQMTQQRILSVMPD